MNPARCPKCSTSMEEGFLMDRSHRSSGKPSEWIEGKPERSFWFGTKTRGKSRIRVATYRCGRCGYLESFAPREEGRGDG